MKIRLLKAHDATARSLLAKNVVTLSQALSEREVGLGVGIKSPLQDVTALEMTYLMMSTPESGRIGGRENILVENPLGIEVQGILVVEVLLINTAEEIIVEAQGETNEIEVPGEMIIAITTILLILKGLTPEVLLDLLGIIHLIDLLRKNLEGQEVDKQSSDIRVSNISIICK